MILSLSHLRPRYSLRLLFVLLLAAAALVAYYRDPLRRRVEALLAGKRGPAPKIVITGAETSGVMVALDPPSPPEIIQALEAAGELNAGQANVRMVIDPISEYVDPPRSYLFVGQSQMHHAHYKCLLITDDGEKTVYIDHKRLCVP